MLTRADAQALYRAGEDAVVRVLLELDQVKAEVLTLRADNAVLRQECQALRDEVHALKAAAAKDSHNSSKPPSSDGLAKPKPKSLRTPSARPTGGQLGHPGQTLRMVPTPDRTVRHPVDRCTGCGRSLADHAPDRVERRQVFDVPEPTLEVTEHQADVKTCPCGCVTRAAFPPEVTAPVQYGPRVKSVAVYLKEYQLLPFDRLTEILRDLFACATFSEGTVANMTTACAHRLAPVEAIIRAQVAATDVVGFDETGVRATGSLHWLHTASTRWLTWYFAHTRRGRDAMDAADILPGFQGRAVHDFWSPYLKYDCDHAFCNAHLLRELVFAWEDQDQAWAKTMIDHLLTIHAAVETARDAGLAALRAEDLDRFSLHYLRIVDAGYAENPVPAPAVGGPTRRGRRGQSKARNLLDRFRDHPDGILAFMRDFAVPFTNNWSERDLRMMKLREKISGSFRSFAALVDFCRIRGYVSTARKNGLSALDALRRAFAGDPFIPTPPTADPALSG